jgi:hypothetical protein
MAAYSTAGIAASSVTASDQAIEAFGSTSC